MRAKIGPFKHFYGPHQLAETLCFWVKKQPDEYGFLDYPDWVDRFGEFLAYGTIKCKSERKVGEVYTLGDKNRKPTWLYRFLLWIDSFRERKISVKIDRWDVWSADHTLAYVILPLLEQLKESKSGAPMVDDEDVPEHLRSSNALPRENTYDPDEFYFDRWNWVMDEMIFAFRSKVEDNWEDQFYSGTPSFKFKKLENGCSEMIRDEDDTFQIDEEGRRAYQARITNGFRLFGKYYEGLWN